MDLEKDVNEYNTRYSKGYIIPIDTPKLKKGIKGIAKPQVVKKDNRVPAKLIVNEQVKVNTPGVMRSESVIYLDLKKLGKHPHSK